ncbi:MAG: hypothetical protein ACRD1R_02820 [Acidobacteriota bacterium]
MEIGVALLEFRPVILKALVSGWRGREVPASVITTGNARLRKTYELNNFLRAPAFSRMNPKAAAGSIVAWSVKYRVCVFFAGDRPHGNALTRQLLEKFWRYQNGDADAGSG